DGAFAPDDMVRSRRARVAGNARPRKLEWRRFAVTEPIWRWSATRIAVAIRNRDICAREALDACLARMAAVNPQLNAVTVDLAQSARVAADEADRAVAKGEPLGALHGVPVTVKENVDQEGCAT